MFEQKKSKSTLKRGESAMVTHKLVRQELFHPERPENVETNELAIELGKKVAEVMIAEFYHPRKVTRFYVSAIGGKFSWEKTSAEEHEAGLGKDANNDKAEGPFALLSRQLDVHGRLESRNASAVATAVWNGIFYRSDVQKERSINKRGDKPDGTFITLSDKMKFSLLTLALEENKSEKEKYAQQRERQLKTLEQKREASRKHAIEKAQIRYMEELYHFDLLHSDECIKDAAELDRVLEALSSNTAKTGECKKQIKIWSLGAGRKDLHHPWSKQGVAYTWEHLAAHLKENIYSKLQDFEIPDKEPEPKMPFTRPLKQLGRNAADVRTKCEEKEKEKEEFKDGAKKMMETKYCQEGHCLSIDEVGDLLSRRIGMKFRYEESSDNSDINMWCYGEVVAVKRNNKFDIKWDDEYVEEGCPNVTVETLDTALFNKNVESAWHVMVDDRAEEDHDDSIFSAVDGYVEDGSRQKSI